MEKGQIVTIYGGPGTQTKIETEAKLLGKIAETKDLQDWEVEFLDDGCIAQRVILKKQDP